LDKSVLFVTGATPRRTTSSLEPMTKNRAFIWVSVCGISLPFLIATTTKSDAYVLSNLISMAAPQRVVIGLALVFPSLRKQIATFALVSLSILLLGFCWITSLDANGAMLWMFYYPAGAIIALVGWLFFAFRRKPRGP
jgi:hypothetical protein